MTTVEIPREVEERVQKSVSGPASALIERIAERVGGAASAAAVFGTPVEREGVTVIPVARVRWGFGGGSGTGEGAEGRGGGEGGGGGVSARPAGYIEITAAGATFKPIRGPEPLLVVPLIIIAAGITARMVLHGVRRIIRG
jgi:uncharacterized spore protein YtfJ